MRERADVKSPVRENRSLGSVRGALGNRRPYLDLLSLKPCSRWKPEKNSTLQPSATTCSLAHSEWEG